MLSLCVICTLTLADLSNQSKQANIRSVESREKKKPKSESYYLNYYENSITLFRWIGRGSLFNPQIVPSFR